MYFIGALGGPALQALFAMTSFFHDDLQFSIWGL